MQLAPRFLGLSVILAASTSSVFAAAATGGQSFTPSVSGTTLGVTPSANSFVGLTDFTFVVSTFTNVPASLYITDALPSSLSATAGAAIASSVDDYTDVASNPSFGGSPTRTYHFATAAALDTDNLYYALFNTSSFALPASNTINYAGGQFYYISTTAYNSSQTAFDTRFAATFAAVPEPSTYAALAGVAALALAAHRRRRAA